MKTLLFAALAAAVLMTSMAAAPSAFANEQAQAKAPPSPALVLGMSLGLPALGYMAGVSTIEHGGSEGVGGFLVFTSVFVLPSAGQMVLGRWGQALVWTGVRIGSAAFLLAGVIAALVANSEVVALGLLLAGIGGYTVGVIGDLVSSYQAAYRARSDHRGFALVPTRSSDGALGARVGWTTTF